MNRLMGLMLGLGLGVGLGLSGLDIAGLVALGSAQGIEQSIELTYRGSGRSPQPSADDLATREAQVPPLIRRVLRN